MTRKDSRLYGRFTLDFPDSPKIAPLSDAAFRALVEMTLYSRRMLTDGFISKRLALARWGLEVCQELTSNDPEKPSLIETEDGWIIHDFAEHQSTKAEIEALSAKRKAAGQKGGRAKALASARQKLEQTPSKTCPETETETYIQKPTTDVVGEKKPAKRAHRIPEGWKPSEATRAWARERYGHLDLNDQYEAFVDHFTAAGGQSARKLDWDRAFKNWLRNARQPSLPRRNLTPRIATSDQRVAEVQALKRPDADEPPRLELA